MPFYRQENFNYLLKKAHENCLLDKAEKPLNFYSIDHAIKARDAILANIKKFQEAMALHQFELPNLPILQEDFFQLDVEKFFASNSMGNVFLPLNPPYGVRLQKDHDTISLYKKIAQRINQISTLIFKNKKHIAGFILCPTRKPGQHFVRI